MYTCHLFFKAEALKNNLTCIRKDEPVFLFFESDVCKIKLTLDISSTNIIGFSDNKEYFSKVLAKHIADVDCRCVSYYG
jgi:hypothetical protein